jgi:hypothetical protein
MANFKRNQIEEAISRVLAGSKEPSQGLRRRLKRLLETDRALGRTPRSTEPDRARYAFFSSEAPGSGVEVWFSEYEAFALLNCLRLMRHGWPQDLAISMMRQVRPELERQHSLVLKRDPASLFDQAAIRRSAKGTIAFVNSNPVLFIIVSDSESHRNEERGLLRCAIRRGAAEATRLTSELSGGTGACTMLDVVGVAHRLAQELARTEPRPRGRRR